MISEPELIGGPDVPPQRGPDGPVDVIVDTGPAPDGPPRPRRSWLWALGGAVAASALWAGGLWAYQAGGPDLRGYRASDDLCADAKLPALVAALGKRGEDAPGLSDRHPALDRAQCTVTLGEQEPWHTVDVTYELHRRTDPGPEFEPLVRAQGWDDTSVRPLPGVGERAFVMQEEGFAWLTAVDGPAVVTVSVGVEMAGDPETGESRPPDTSALAGIEEFLAEDVKTLMAGLREPAQ
ncbi:hypothetical protein [Streptomyces sp. SP18CS02]|uniref:hypothetical protein n=1 Tax=Streptomyces sp. SP18CS02 TaxID=3002531 RepID=UPI002E7A2219|nr:hypothetical protein [Streptomyces sp. SP18CS02]MEE1756309.1 hypothetical protein [Streptomyces sp. SP18CS02]